MRNIIFFIFYIFIGITQLSAQTGTRHNPMSLQNEEKVVLISPNPATNQITVNASKVSTKVNSIAIYSIIGNEVLNIRPESNTVVMNVANLKR